MRIDLLTTWKLPETPKTYDNNITGETPEQIVEIQAAEANNTSEIVELTRIKKAPFQLNRLLLYFCWGVFLLSAIFFLLGEYFDYEFSTGELISIQGELDEYQANLSEEYTLKNIHQVIQSRNLEIANLSGLYPRHLMVIKSLSDSLPEGVWLTSIHSNDKGEVAVKGQSYIFAKVGDYLKRLKEIELFRSLKLREIKRQTLPKTIFSFTIEIEAGGASLEYKE